MKKQHRLFPPSEKKIERKENQITMKGYRGKAEEQLERWLQTAQESEKIIIYHYYL